MKGFRAGAMHRNQDWFNVFDFEYDMSVPTVSHLEPQSGGCCTVILYFIGKAIKLPLTTIRDYALFFILSERSIELRKQQIRTISAHRGLISFIIHPDYIVSQQSCRLYTELPQYVQALGRDENVWMALPIEINQWWRERSRMQLVREGDRWRIQGAGAHVFPSARSALARGRQSSLPARGLETRPVGALADHDNWDNHRRAATAGAGEGE